MDTKVGPNNNLGIPANATREADRTLLDEIAKNDQAKKKGNVETVSPNSRRGVDVELSPDARALADAHAKAFDIAINSPEVREEKVAELKAKIQNGTYKINAPGIADGILREAILDKLAEQDS